MFARKQAYFVKRAKLQKKTHAQTIQKNLFIELNGVQLFLNIGKSVLSDLNYCVRFCFPLGFLFVMLLMSVALMHAIKPAAYIANNLSKMTIFFQLGTTEGNIQSLNNQLIKNQMIRESKIIWSDSALSQIGLSTRNKEMESGLVTNPLPHVIVLYPQINLNLKTIQALYKQLKHLPAVSTVKFDIQWLQRVMSLWQVLNGFFVLFFFLLILWINFFIQQQVKSDIQDISKDIKLMRTLGVTRFRISQSYCYNAIWSGLLISSWVFIVSAVVMLIAENNQFSSLNGIVSGFQHALIQQNPWAWTLFIITVCVLANLSALRHYFRHERLN